MNRVFLLLLFLLSLKAEAQSSVLSIADSLYANGNYTKAITNYEIHDNQQDVYSKLAKAYVTIGSYDKALSNYELGLNAYPNNALLKYDYAKLLAKTKKYEEASKLFYELIDHDYRNPNYHFELGLIFEQLKEPFKSQSRFFNTYELDETHQKAIFKLAKFQLKKRNYEVSHKYIDAGLKSYGNNTSLISLKAQNYYSQHEYEKAIVWFEKLLQLGEDSQFIHEKLSISYENTYDNKKAIEHLILALELDGKDVVNLYRLGYLYKEDENFEKAKEYMELALKLQDLPLDHEYVQLASVYNHLKQPQKAIWAFKRALKENPSNEYAVFLLVHTKADFYKDLDAKIKLYENYIEKHPKTKFTPMAKQCLSELKKKQFMKGEQ